MATYLDRILERHREVAAAETAIARRPARDAARDAAAPTRGSAARWRAADRRSP